MSEQSAILFPGQGSQSANMGKAHAEKNNEIMDLWKKAEKYSSLPLREIYWESADEALMANTKNLQPALTVTNLGAWLEHKDKVSPCAFAGHSLGEFSALAAAKVLSFDDVLQLVSLRGKLMDSADPNKEGTMYVVLRLSAEEIEPICKLVSEESGRVVKIANYNTPKQFAISGHRDAVESVIDRLKPQKAKAIPLAVSGAFHTPLMAEINVEFAKELERYHWSDPISPIYCNVNAEAITEAKRMLNIMKKQIVSSVLWTQIITNIHKSNVQGFAEVGPKGVLIRMIPHILTDAEVHTMHYE